MARLRVVEEKDLAVIRRWRNHPSINHYMFTQTKVTESDHLTWFLESREDPFKFLFVYQEAGDTKGFLQLQKQSEDSDVYEWGFYTSPNATAGLGTRMANLLFDKLFMEMNASKLFGEVLSFNQPSIRFHKKLGFSQEGLLRAHHCLKDQSHDVYCFGLLKSEYLINRSKADSEKEQAIFNKS